MSNDEIEKDIKILNEKMREDIANENFTISDGSSVKEFIKFCIELVEKNWNNDILPTLDQVKNNLPEERKLFYKDKLDITYQINEKSVMARLKEEKFLSPYKKQANSSKELIWIRTKRKCNFY